MTDTDMNIEVAYFTALVEAVQELNETLKDMAKSLDHIDRLMTCTTTVSCDGTRSVRVSR